MKIYYIVFFLLFLCISCSKKTGDIGDKQMIECIPNEHDVVNHSDTTMMILAFENTEDTLGFTKQEFRQIADFFLATIEEDSVYVRSPEEVYEYYLSTSDAMVYGGEAGQDTFYMLYAHFLKMKNRDDNELRGALISIYRNINSLMGQIQGGGTYFGHMHARILGYVEYKVHYYSLYEDYYETKYDISKQKELYIKLLKQIVDDEISVNMDVVMNNKLKEKRGELFEIIDCIDKQITTKFHLKQAQEFQYSKY